MTSYNGDLKNYETENTWLNTPYNKTIAYVPGKGVTENERGEIQFYYLDNINDFVYGQDIEPEFLFPQYAMEPDELESLAKLRAANTYLNGIGLHAVYLRTEKKKPYLFFLSENYPDKYFKILYEKHTELTAELPAVKANTIETAYLLEV